MEWKVVIAPIAKKHLQAITDRRIQKAIEACINDLTNEPLQKGKPLRGNFAGFRSIRAYRQRYRIIYKVDAEQMIVYIYLVGIRRAGDKSDVYALAQKLLRLDLMILSLPIFLLPHIRFRSAIATQISESAR